MAGCRERMIGHNISVKWDVELVEVESQNWWEVGCCSTPRPPPPKKNKWDWASVNFTGNSYRVFSPSLSQHLTQRILVELISYVAVM